MPPTCECRPRAGLARGRRGRRALRERHDRPLRARARRRAARLAARRPAARRVNATAATAAPRRSLRAMGILDEDVARVREATDLVALVGEHIALKRVGRRFSGLCPFHTEKSPSFSINPENGRVLLLRLPEERRRDHVRPRGRAPRLRRSGRAARGARRHHAALRRRVVLRRTRKRKQRLHEAVARGDRRSTTSCCSSRRRRARARATCAAAASTATRRAGSRSAGRPTATTR